MSHPWMIILIGLLSMLPFTELRFSIPFAIIGQKINFITAFFICSIFNILVIILIFLFLDYLHKYLLNVKIYREFFNKIVRVMRKKTETLRKRKETLGMFALTLFVAIPLPITGAWTGTIIAWLLNLNRKKSFFAIALGVLIAGIIVTLLTLAGILTYKGIT